MGSREVCEHFWPLDNKTPCPKCNELFSTIRRLHVWGAISPKGEVNMDSQFKNEDDVWMAVLGLPTPEEIQTAKSEGWEARQMLVIIEDYSKG